MVPAKKNLNVVAAYSDSESESESDHSWGGYVCELDTDGIDSSDDEHLKARIAAKTMSIGNFSFNIDQAEILFKDAGGVVEVRFPNNEVAVFRGFEHVELPPLLAKKKPDPNHIPSDPESDYSGADVNANFVCKNDTDAK
ncbi:uncharacterized protein LOC112488889 [Ziziphus jujuba]|uniref:Uncharacterized protein LOC112488889 n=1 Tax=Ziziphus jujuba TaxID=326968 RepID=A0ABM3I6J7_ZIZJJ|nr:uncharacterized protein LOC112488889 [Ziziphus jujuba]